VNAQRVYRFFPALVALLTFATFLPALQNDWVNWDDTDNFLQNPSYRGLGWTELKWMWTTQMLRHYIPLSWMTLGLDYKLWGMDPFGYHLTNVLLHTANAVVFYLLAIAIFKITIPAEARSRIPMGALFAALLFAVHPLRVESVAWITERRDVLSGLFYLLAILAYVHAYDPGRPIRRKYYWFCLASFVLALLSKEVTVTLPALLLLLDVYPLHRLPATPLRWMERQVRGIWWEKVPFFALSLGMIIVVWHTSTHTELLDALAGWGRLPRIGAAFYNLAFYLGKTLAPVRLSPMYGFNPHTIDPTSAPFELSILVVLAITTTAILLRRKFPALLTVWLAYALTLSPVLGFFANGPTVTYDRNTYLACLGWALLAGAAVILWTESSRAGRWMIQVTAALAILSLAALTRQQIRIWHDSDALWTHALAVGPSFVAYTNMGEVLASRGDDLWAMEHFRKAIEMRPDFSPAHIGLGGCLLRVRRPAEAAVEFQTVLSLGKDQAFAHNGLACALAWEGKLDEAINHFQQAIQLRPDYVDARRNLAQVLARKRLLPQSVQ
jgi:tetratricopeptide (TPR) repeat protein